MKASVCALACAVITLSAPAAARLTTITISSVEPFAPGASFGDAGAYERVKGVFRGELDPQDPRNRVIVNLDKAPRNASGKVEYEADFFMLRPADRAAVQARYPADQWQLLGEAPSTSQGAPDGISWLLVRR